MKFFRLVSALMVCVGLGLFALNVVGLFVSLRNPAIYNESQTSFQNDITLDETSLYRAVERLPDESNEAYVLRVTRAVNQGLAHYWSDEGPEGINKYNLRIPPYENYLLWLYSYLNPAVYEKYEFCDYRKAIERGVGYCSEHAIVTSDILRQNGVDTKIANLSQLHVVVLAQVDAARNVWWVSDPDYGVIIKHDLNEIEDNPHIVEKDYLDAGHDFNRVEYLVSIYDSPGKMLFDGAAGYCGYRDVIERTTYAAIWVIPIVLMLAGMRFYLVARRVRPR